MNTIGGPRHARRAVPRQRRWKAVRFVLAGGALVGVGAVATTAAWTDNAFFSAAADSGSVSLQASTSSNGPWDNADTGNGVTFAGTAFGSLVPGVTRTATIYVKNAGTVCLSVPAPTVTKAEPLAGTSTTADATVTVSAVGNLPSGTSKLVTVTVTTPPDWSTSHQNKTSVVALTVQFQGSTIVNGLAGGACPS